MPGLNETGFVLGLIGARNFIAEQGTVTYVEGQLVELSDIIKVSGLEGTREVKVYKPLNNGGYPKKAALGKDNADMVMELVRSDTGSLTTSTYNYLRDWFEANDETNPEWREHIEVKPRGTVDGKTAYEARKRIVCITKFNYGDLDVELGQEYTVEFAVSSKPISMTVTEDEGGKLTFTKPKGA